MKQVIKLKPFKRGESFRYTFKNPLPGRFKLHMDQGKERASTKEGALLIKDISPKGMRFRTEYTLPVDRLDFEMEIYFELMDQQITMAGRPIWRKGAGKDIYYGFTLVEDAETEELIIETLKSYSKKDKKKQ
ncbi:PilZ domain-containing protein [Rossellomorea aquimaris]|uniref:PilZ domain-containing protein n=1 Tax=Rossellomorea aquimaris TaxID=189382 RepID=A0A5D4U857_9BACI|nr:PilZ domain-containing protein [Rossellomorea aquimaris]